MKCGGVAEDRLVDHLYNSIFAKIEMTRNENRLTGRHFETVQIFLFFFWSMVVISVYI